MGEDNKQEGDFSFHAFDPGMAAKLREEWGYNVSTEIIPSASLMAPEDSLFQYKITLYGLKPDELKKLNGLTEKPGLGPTAGDIYMLLTGEQYSDCFVATAVYGDPFHPNVDSLRHLRDNVLEPNSIGNLAVRLYYSGPGKMAAGLIGKTPGAIPLVKMCLDACVAVYEKYVRND